MFSFDLNFKSNHFWEQNNRKKKKKQTQTQALALCNAFVFCPSILHIFVLSAHWADDTRGSFPLSQWDLRNRDVMWPAQYHTVNFHRSYIKAAEFTDSSTTFLACLRCGLVWGLAESRVSVYDSFPLSVLVGLCQLDTSYSPLRGAKPNWENASVRYGCRQACQEFSYLVIDGKGPSSL